MNATMAETAARYPAWTKTLPEADLRVVLAEAEPGRPSRDWTAACDRALPQPSRIRRREVTTSVRRALLDLDADDRIKDTGFLRAAREGPPRLQHDLVFARYLGAIPLAVAAATEVVEPAIQAAEAPLAPADAGVIPQSSWDTFLARVLAPGTPPPSSKKTRSTLTAELGRAGILTAGRRGSRKLSTGRRHALHPLAFGWLLLEDLRRAHATEITDRVAVRRSLPARLFCTGPAHAANCLSELISRGVLARSYLAGEPRVTIAGADTASDAVARLDAMLREARS